MWNPADKIHEQALDIIRASELNDDFDQLAPRLQFSIDVRVEESHDDGIPLGAHKIGGSPDVAPDFAWPTWNDEPLTFIAQFDLTSLAPFDVKGLLPPRGILSLFNASSDEI